MLLAVNCFGGVLRLFIDLLCTLQVGWLCCFICCGWWLLCLVVCCGVAVVMGVVGVYLVGIAIGVVCWLGVACDLIGGCFVNSVVVMHYTFVYSLLCCVLLLCGWMVWVLWLCLCCVYL